MAEILPKKFIKQRREESGPCSICLKIAKLTDDHIPPKVAGNSGPTYLSSALSAISGHPQEYRPSLRQDGLKIRSICGPCNSKMGKEYDPVIGRFCQEISKYIGYQIARPIVTCFETQPARLLRGVLAHMLAGKLSPNPQNPFDQKIRDYLIGETPKLDKEVKVFYWLNPHQNISVFNDLVIFPRTSSESIYCNILKFHPLGFLTTDSPNFQGLPNLGIYSDLPLDESRCIEFNFRSQYDQDWPEGPDHNNFVLTSKSTDDSLHGVPRERCRK